MSFCSKCGKQAADNDIFCAACGNKLVVNSSETVEKYQTMQNSSSNNQNGSSVGGTVKAIGVALTIIGLIAGIFVIIFMSSHGTALGYDSWNFYYGGGRETGIGVAVFAGASFLIGLCMLIGSTNRK